MVMMPYYFNPIQTGLFWSSGTGVGEGWIQPQLLNSENIKAMATKLKAMATRQIDTLLPSAILDSLIVSQNLQKAPKVIKKCSKSIINKLTRK